MWENISYAVSLKLYKISSRTYGYKIQNLRNVNHTTVYVNFIFQLSYLKKKHFMTLKVVLQHPPKLVQYFLSITQTHTQELFRSNLLPATSLA